MFLVVPEASLAPGGPANLRMEAQGTERVAGLAIGGARGGSVDRHRSLLVMLLTVIVQLGPSVSSYSISGYNWPQ